MIVVTGGAGFLGSNVIAEMEVHGLGPIAVCDEFGPDERWRNLAKHTIDRFIPPDDIGRFLRFRGEYVQAVVHMGAIASTTETDVGRLIDANVESFRRVWNGCSKAQIPMIYASSASVYGLDPACVDDDGPAAIRALRPMNAYGWSKKVCDESAVAWSAAGWRPPFWGALRLFNVYGPNEGHKLNQRSYVSKALEAALLNKPIKLFPGDFTRDWVYALDVAKIVVDLLTMAIGNGASKAPPSGIYNVGSGEAHSFEGVLDMVAKAVGAPLRVEREPMPEAMRAGYQPRTCAPMAKLRAVLPDLSPTPLEDGLAHYVFAFCGSGWDAYR